MNMKRGLVLSLVALAGMASAAMAQSNVSLSLNLRYNDPATPAEGGRWFLMAKTDSAVGLAGVSAYISGIDTTGIVLGNPTAAGAGSTLYPVISNTATGSIANSGNPYNGVFEDGAVDPVNIVWGFDLSATGSLLANVGRTGGPGEVAGDPLRKISGATGVVGGNWNNAALLASGTFGATRPEFVDDVGPNNNDTAANVLQNTTLGTPAVAATVFKTVRGDSLNTLNLEAPGGAEGIRFGDLNRDFSVSITTDILPALASIGSPGTKTWDQGDFNGNGSVAITTDILPALANVGQPGLPPSVASIPEPASIGLGLAGLLGLGLVRRRS
jgi:hypothetical protein